MGIVNLNPSNASASITENIRGSDTVTTVNATATASIALAANPLRSYYSIFNAGTTTVFLRENAIVSATLYKHPLPPGYLFEQEFPNSKYLGDVSVITQSGTSSLMVTESEIT